MQKRLIFLLLYCFIIVQSLAAMHLAEHGFESHEHHGKICDIFLHGEAAKYSAISDATELATPVSQGSALTFAHYKAPIFVPYLISHPRAPPVFG